MTFAVKEKMPMSVPEQRTVTVLGSTGSIGTSTVDLLLSEPERFDVDTLTAHRNVDLLVQQARQLRARTAVIADETLYDDLKKALSGTGITPQAGEQALVEAASGDAGWVMSALVGACGLKPTLAAIRQGKTVALANKECLVCAGDLMMAEVQKSGATLLPVDSEHNAIFQVLDMQSPEKISRLILTASGGAFLSRSRAELKGITPEQAVKHPNWSMGRKISVDSATMMNKALELIEAHYLFAMPPEKIDVVIHPQSVIHSMVEYVDGSVLAQMGAPDMRTPIAYTLAWPTRMKSTGQKLDLTKTLNLSLQPADEDRFIALSLARRAMRLPGGATVLNAANEVAVAAFLEGKLSFDKIEQVTEMALEKIDFEPISDIEAVLELDKRSRMLAQDCLSALN